MGSHPVNLAIRFLLEIIGLVLARSEATKAILPPLPK